MSARACKVIIDQGAKAADIGTCTAGAVALYGGLGIEPNRSEIAEYASAIQLLDAAMSRMLDRMASESDSA